MSNHATVISTLFTLSGHTSTFTLYAPYESSATLSTSGQIFNDGSTRKTTTGYITVVPNTRLSNVWTLQDSFPYTGYSHVESVQASALDIRSTLYSVYYKDSPLYISTPHLQTSSISHQGIAVPLDTDHTSTFDGLGGTYVSSGLYYIASTIDGLGQFGYVSTSWLQSTVDGLGKTYISTPSLLSTISGNSNYVQTHMMRSTVDNLGQLYFSTASLVSTVSGLSNIYINSNNNASTVSAFGTLERTSLVSTVTHLANSDSMTYISSTSLQSTVRNLGQLYASSAQLQLSVGNYTQTIRVPLIQRMVESLAGSNTADATYLSSFNIQSTLTGITKVVASNLVPHVTTLGYVSSLTSTIAGLGNAIQSNTGYISSLSLQSTVFSLTINQAAPLVSTVVGLGVAIGPNTGYISTVNLVSSVTGLSNIYATQFPYSNMIYLSTPAFRSTVNGLGTLYISASQLTSTHTSLTTIASIPYFQSNFPFVTTTGMVSTVNGLGQTYISYSGLISTSSDLIATFISPTQLTSSMTGSIVATSNANCNMVASTLRGLGSLGYVSGIAGQSPASLNSFVQANTAWTVVANAYTNGYLYYTGGINLASSSNFYEELTTSISRVPFSNGEQLNAVTIKTFGYGSNYIYGDGTYMTIASDRRLKDQIEPLTSTLSQVLSLRGVTYTKKGDSNAYLGCIAQEVEPVFPEVIITHPDPMQLKSMKYEFLLAPLVESVKELAALHSRVASASASAEAAKAAAAKAAAAKEAKRIAVEQKHGEV